MRRTLRKIAENQTDQIGDTTTLADPGVVEALAQGRQVILLLLGKIKSIAELPAPKNLEQMRKQFRAFIQKEAPQCSGDYLKAVGVARHSYALLLAEKLKMRTEFSKQDNLNVFGDTRIIQNTLFMQAGILSSDKPGKRMATYAGLECVSKIS